MTNDPWPKTRASLLQRLSNTDDHEAWKLMVEIYGPLIYRCCISRDIQPSDAFDLTQDVLIQLRDFDYQPERGKFRSWLGKVVRNRIALFWRQHRVKGQPLSEQLESLEEACILNWEKIFNTHILDAAIKRIRNEFSDECWTAFQKLALAIQQEDNGVKRFVWQSNVSAQSVAQDLDRPVEWVYKSKSKVLQRLRDEILLLAEETGVLERF